MRVIVVHIKSIEAELQKVAQDRKVLLSGASSSSSSSKGFVRVDDETRKEVASTLLKNVDSAVSQAPIQIEQMDNAHSKNSRMVEEKIRREKKRIAAQLLKERAPEINDEKFLVALEALKVEDQIMHLDKTEARLKNDLYRLRLLCGSAGEQQSSRSNMQEEKLRREKKKLSTPATPRLDISESIESDLSLSSPSSSSSSSSSSPFTRQLPPIKDGLFVKSAEIVKLSQAPPLKSISRLERMKEEARRRNENELAAGTPLM